jgi:hypothetical protein
MASIAAKHPEKSTYEHIKLLVDELTNLQSGLPIELQNPHFFRDRLIKAYERSTPCQGALLDPPFNLADLVNKIQSSISLYEVNHKRTGTYTATADIESDDEDNNEAYFGADRKYQSNRRRFQPRSFNRPSYRNSGSTSNSRGRCWVYKKEDCRSFKHTEEEQQEAKAKWRAGLVARDNGDPKTFGRRFAKGFRAYTTECEGDSEEEITSQISALMMDAESDNDTNELTASKEST